MSGESGYDMPRESNVWRHGLWLVARVAWVAVALLALGIFVLSISNSWAELQKPCLEGARACSDKGLLTRGNVHQLERLGLSVRTYSAYVIALRVVSLTVWVVVGAVIFWRKSEDLMALLVASALVTFGGSFQSFSYGTSFGISSSFLAGLSGAYSPLLSFLFHLLAALGFTTLILFFYLFPDARFVPWWSLFPALLWIANDCVAVFFPELFAVYRWGDVVGSVLFLVPALCAVGSQVYRYLRVSTQAQRQQTKWVIFGTAIGFYGAFLVLVVLQGVLPGFDQRSVLGGLFSQTITTLLFTMIPLSIGIAVLRSRLFDIDVVINRALVYGALTAMLALVYLGSVVTLQYLFRTLTDETSQIVVVASTLIIAALFNPLRRRVQNLVDRRFYRRKYDAARTLEAFSSRLRDETNLEDLNAHLMAVVRETMQPSHASLWLRDSGR